MINYFEKVCQDVSTSILFGIVDPDGSRAKISTSELDKWIAVIDNPLAKKIVFTAIDQCIEILRENGEQEKSCDGMLTYDKDIDFIELKEVRRTWIRSGMEQLHVAITVFSSHNDLEKYRRKRAFLANRLHPQFQHSHKETMQRFRDQTGVRLIITNKVKI